MKLQTLRACALAGSAVLSLTACGQKGALTLPDTRDASPIVIRETQTGTPTSSNGPATAAEPAPASATPAPAAPTTPNRTPPQH
jgi:predicted small lipoprotein YifL